MTNNRNMSQTEIIDRLTKLLETEHISGCEQNTCDISKCFEYGYALWAIYLFSGTGASSEKFDKLYSQLDKSFMEKAEAERNEFVDNVDSVSCPHCNAVIYDPVDCRYFCDNCAKTATFKVITNTAGPDGIEPNDEFVREFKVIEK